MSMSHHGSEQQTAGPSEAPAAEVTINIEVSDHWKTRCRQIQRYAADCKINQRPYPEGLTDRHLRIAKKISTLDEAPEGEEQWMSKWGVHPQSWPQFWRSFEKERKTWNVVLSEDSDDLGLEEVTGFGFVDQDQDGDSDTRYANPDVQDECSTDGVPVERDAERSHVFAVPPETSIGHEPAVQYDSQNIPAVAHHTHKPHLVETIAPRTVADPATIPQTLLGSHGESHDQRRGLGTCPPQMAQAVERAPVYQAHQSKSPTFIAPAQDQEPYRHARPPPMPLVEPQTPQPSIATRSQAMSLPNELMFLKPMEALQKARREAKAAGRSRFG